MDDQTLLARYAAIRDADAFEMLVQRHAGFVKAVCLRVLHNSHDAEEITQDCFLELARHARDVHTSVVGWLHRSATSRSLNLVRSRTRRKLRERVVSIPAEKATSVEEASTLELHRIINGSLKELPEDLRLPMMLHYVDGQSQREVAVALGVNQSTISRRVQDALQRLRDKLTQAGYVATAPAVMLLTPDKAAIAASDPTVVKIAFSGTAGNTAAGSTLLSSFKAMFATALPVLSYLMFGGWISLLVAVGVTLYAARRRPNWIKDLFSSLGVRDLYDQPTFCLSRWTWTTPPEAWRVQIVNSLMWAVFFAGLSFAFVLGTDQPIWGIFVLGTAISMALSIHALRLFHRVQRISDGGSRTVSPLRLRVIEFFNAGWVESSSPTNFDAASSGVRRLDPPCVVSGLDRLDRGDSPALRPSRARNDFIKVFLDQMTGFDPNDPTWTWIDAAQLIGIGLAGVGMTLQVVLFPQPQTVWPSVMLAACIGSGMLLIGVRLCRRMVTNHTTLAVLTAWVKSFMQRGPVMALSAGDRIVVAEATTVKPGSETDIRNVRGANGMLIAAPKREATLRTSNPSWTGTYSVLALGVSLIVGLSGWIVWNPYHVHAVPLSLAAVQTSILGWILYRLAANCQRSEAGVVQFGGDRKLDPPCDEEPRDTHDCQRAFPLSRIRYAMLFVLISCFVLNSSVCLANWLR